MLRRTPTVLAWLMGAVSAHAQLSITHRGGVELSATAIDQHGQPFAITGLSGITYAGPGPNGHRFICVMDNSNRLVLVNANLDEDGRLTGAVPAFHMRVWGTGCACCCRARGSEGGRG